MFNINRVRAGALYMYWPVPLDRWMPPSGVITGRLGPGMAVRAVDMPGHPVNSLGHACIADPGTAKYLGLVHCNSLRSITRAAGASEPEDRTVFPYDRR